MTAKDKQLLLKDLCARFTYGTIVSVTDGTIKYNAYIESISYKYIQVSPVDSDSNFTAYTFYKISEIKPYLRPISSMTEEEKENLLNTVFGNEESKKFFKVNTDGGINNVEPPTQDLSNFTLHWVNFDCINIVPYIDWLNAHHFDYRGLISQGLALEAPDGMYKS